jgi:hypothetical protein
MGSFRPVPPTPAAPVMLLNPVAALDADARAVLHSVAASRRQVSPAELGVLRVAALKVAA